MTAARPDAFAIRLLRGKESAGHVSCGEGPLTRGLVTSLTGEAGPWSQRRHSPSPSTYLRTTAACGSGRRGAIEPPRRCLCSREPT
eukprot:1388030-Prymnesium_polylepis.1